MTGIILDFACAVVLFGWGIAHLLPTGKVVEGFGTISVDNKRIITMEWIIEGYTLILIGGLVCLVTIVDHAALISRAVYLYAFMMLNVLSVISLRTGFKISFLPFKLCPVVFTGASILLLVGLIV
ncbi:MAG TPA: hypothetical protein VL126_09625 [Bacteroidota bacterium]|nr:hypothetical protein [Bacteroidota bacterium]